MKKYKIIRGRCRALLDFSDVKAGDVGGYLDGEHNLSHDGLCWVYDRGRVCGNALVSDDARVYDLAVVIDNARLYEDARIFDTVRVVSWAKVYGHARIIGDVIIGGKRKFQGKDDLIRLSNRKTTKEETKMSNDPIMDAIANAKAVENRYPFIGPGNHELELVQYKRIESSKNRLIQYIAVAFAVVKSDGAHSPGDKVSALFQLTGFQTEAFQAGAHGRLNGFTRDLVKSFFPNPSSAELAGIMRDLCGEQQIGRGLRIRAQGVSSPQKKDPSKSFTNVNYTPILGQTAESRKANCARQDAGDSPATGETGVTRTASGGFLAGLPATTPDAAPAAVEAPPAATKTLW